MTDDRAALVQMVLGLSLSGFSAELYAAMARRGFIRATSDQKWAWDEDAVRGLSDAALKQLHYALTAKV